MNSNAKPTERVAILATIDPASQAASTVTSGWVAAANWHFFLAKVSTGVLGASATVDFKVQQAQDGTGTGAKDLSGKAITQIVAATGNNKQAAVNFRSDDLDSTGGFTYVRVSLTVGTAASLVYAELLGFSPRFAPASDFNQAAVAQVV